MTTLRECADTAAAALVEMLRTTEGASDTATIADVIERVLNQATAETEEGAQRRLVDLEASMQRRLTRLLDASPAVIYSFKARDDFAPIFVSLFAKKRSKNYNRSSCLEVPPIAFNAAS